MAVCQVDSRVNIADVYPISGYKDLRFYRRIQDRKALKQKISQNKTVFSVKSAIRGDIDLHLDLLTDRVSFFES